MLAPKIYSHLMKCIGHLSDHGRYKGVNDLIDNTFIRFLIVGSINTLFGYLIFVLFIYLNVHYTMAALLSTILGILFNFKTTGRLVFGNKDNMLIFKFFGVYTITYLINIAALRVFKLYKFDMYLAGFLLLPPTAVIAFTLNKKFVFKG